MKAPAPRRGDRLPISAGVRSRRQRGMVRPSRRPAKQQRRQWFPCGHGYTLSHSIVIPAKAGIQGREPSSPGFPFRGNDEEKMPTSSMPTLGEMAGGGMAGRQLAQSGPRPAAVVAMGQRGWKGQPLGWPAGSAARRCTASTAERRRDRARARLQQSGGIGWAGVVNALGLRQLDDAPRS